MSDINLRQIGKIICFLVALVLSCWPSQASGQSPSLMWGKPVQVTHVEKPRRTQSPERKKRIIRKIVNKKPVLVQLSPLLALRWSVQQRDQAKQVKPAHPDSAFKVGNQLRLVVEVNQDGYLYMVQEGQMMMLFPDKRIKNGDNHVIKGQKIVVPSVCDKEREAADNCWFDVEGGDDDLTLIFSRDRLDDLFDSLDQRGNTIIKKERLAEVKRGTAQQFSKVNLDTFTVQYTNLNREDNEELIIETKIRHQ